MGSGRSEREQILVAVACGSHEGGHDASRCDPARSRRGAREFESDRQRTTMRTLRLGEAVIVYVRRIATQSIRGRSVHAPAA